MHLRSNRHVAIHGPIVLVLALVLSGCEAETVSGFTPGLEVDAPDVGDTSDATPDASAPGTDPTRRLYDLLQTRGTFIPLQTRQRLETDLTNAGKAWKAGSSCDLAVALEAFIKNLQPVTESPPVLVTQLTTLARIQARIAVRAARAAGKPCTGFEAVDTPLGLKAFAPSDTQARAEITFPPADLRLVWSELDKRAFAELLIPGVEGAGTRTGKPQIPFKRLLVAIPEGATFRFASSNLKTREKLRLDLVPVRPDNRVINPPFARSTWRYDAELYGTGGRYPESPCTFDEAGAYRGLRLGFITCFAGQLDLATRTLTLFSGLEVTVTFSGTKGWASKLLESGFEDLDLIASTAINGPMLETGRRVEWGFTPGVIDLTGRGPCTESSGDRGESFLIFTTPKFRAQADRLAELRRREGIPTRVVNALVGDTQASLDQILETRFRTCPIRPEYVLLFGDSDTLPAHMQLRLFDGVDPVFVSDKGNLASDALLAHLGPVDAFPDFSVGRLPVKTVEEAERVVAFLERWQSAPTSATRDYFRRVAVAGGFECCATGEDVPEGQEANLFVAKVRDLIIAANNRGLDLSVHMTRTGDDTTPRLDAYGSELPPPLRPEDRYPWSAARPSDVRDAFTRGTSLFVYSNHGGPDIWSEPGGVEVTSMASIDNAETFSPFVINFTCLANYFDDEQNPGVFRAGPGRHMGELLILGNRTLTPAVGVPGSTRVSWSYPTCA